MDGASPITKDSADTKRKENWKRLLKIGRSALSDGRRYERTAPAFTQLLLHCNKNVITDAVIAAEQAISCIRAARLNVEINAKYVKDEF
ncbi:MAG: cyclodeaminase/cyclohydrolase family protein [Dialister invisus]